MELARAAKLRRYVASIECCQHCPANLYSIRRDANLCTYTVAERRVNRRIPELPRGGGFPEWCPLDEEEERA